MLFIKDFFKFFVIVVAFFSINLLSISSAFAVKKKMSKNDNRSVNVDKGNPKVIGISVSYEINTSYESEKMYLYDKQYLRTRYIDQFAKACKNKNIVFVMVPVNERQIDKIANLVDGMIFTGGDDIDPSLFGQKRHVTVKDVEPARRVKFDMNLIKKLVKQEKPVLGICLGAQEMNIVFGGDVMQDIDSEIPSSNINHRCSATRNCHSIKIKENSLLEKILKKKHIDVNSRHHQAVGKIADNFHATAVAQDGVVEAIECKTCKNFTLGVQWHPEFLIDKNSINIIQSFCEAVEGKN